LITLFASIVGFISSIMPDILRSFQDRRDKQHQLNIIEQQIHAYDKGVTTDFEAYKIKSDNEEAKNLYSTYKSGVRWVDTINASVRPVLAYAFFSLYAYIKFRQFKLLRYSEDISVYIEQLWTVDDQAIFAGIISFYFGQRAFIKRMTFARIHQKNL